MATSQIDCINIVSAGTPDEIKDLSSLTISLDNQGFATLSISIFAKEGTNIDLSDFDSFPVSSSETFRGFIDSVSPQPDNGSDYIDYRVVAKGIIC